MTPLPSLTQNLTFGPDLGPWSNLDQLTCFPISTLNLETWVPTFDLRHHYLTPNLRLKLILTLTRNLTWDQVLAKSQVSDLNLGSGSSFDHSQVVVGIGYQVRVSPDWGSSCLRSICLNILIRINNKVVTIILKGICRLRLNIFFLVFSSMRLLKGDFWEFLQEIFEFQWNH